jgi:hypothetical protein
MSEQKLGNIEYAIFDMDGLLGSLLHPLTLPKLTTQCKSRLISTDGALNVATLSVSTLSLPVCLDCTVRVHFH